jgi:hypothetical protein
MSMTVPGAVEERNGSKEGVHETEVAAPKSLASAIVGVSNPGPRSAADAAGIGTMKPGPQEMSMDASMDPDLFVNDIAQVPLESEGSSKESCRAGKPEAVAGTPKSPKAKEIRVEMGLPAGRKKNGHHGEERNGSPSTCVDLLRPGDSAGNEAHKVAWDFSNDSIVRNASRMSNESTPSKDAVRVPSKMSSKRGSTNSLGNGGTTPSKDVVRDASKSSRSSISSNGSRREFIGRRESVALDRRIMSKVSVHRQDILRNASKQVYRRELRNSLAGADPSSWFLTRVVLTPDCATSPAFSRSILCHS